MFLSLAMAAKAETAAANKVTTHKPLKYADPKTNAGLALRTETTTRKAEPTRYPDVKTNPALFRSNAVRHSPPKKKSYKNSTASSSARPRFSYDENAGQDTISVGQCHEGKKGEKEDESAMQWALFNLLNSSKERLLRVETEKAAGAGAGSGSKVAKVKASVKKVFRR